MISPCSSVNSSLATIPAAGPVIEHLRDLAAEFLDGALDGVSEADQTRVRDVLARVRTNLAGGLNDRRRA